MISALKCKTGPYGSMQVQGLYDPGQCFLHICLDFNIEYDVFRSDYNLIQVEVCGRFSVRPNCFSLAFQTACLRLMDLCVAPQSGWPADVHIIGAKSS
jgi:hypothetical protein